MGDHKKYLDEGGELYISQKAESKLSFQQYSFHII